MSAVEPSPSPSSSDLGEDSYLSSKSLPELLTMMPEKLGFEVHNADPKRVSIYTLRLLYFFAAEKGKYYDDIFPWTSDYIGGEFPQFIDDVWSSSYCFFDDDDENSQGYSHKGRICAREIPPGEPVYNCYDCGVDPTCCMCAHCFNEREHSDHNVSRHISQGNAICDCGDASSWKKTLDCLANKGDQSSDSSELPQELKKSITNTIESALDFFLDVQSTNVQVLRSTSDNRTDQELVTADEEVDDLTFLDGPKYGIETDCLCSWYLIAWNDEFHDWNTAVKTISLARHGFDEDSGQMSVNLASIIDSKGYTSILQASKVEDLIGAFSQFRNTGMTATVLSAKAAVRLEAADAAIKFISKIVHCTNSKVAEFSMKILSELLLKEYPSFFYIDKSKLSVDDENSLLCSDGIPLIDRGKVDIPPLNTVSDLLLEGSRSFPPVTPTKVGTKKDFSRLQLLFFLERRFPKCTRKILKALVVPVITSTAEFRTQFGLQITEILPTLEHINQYYDREWHLSLLESFRLQIYHDPCIGTVLLEKGTFKNILESALGCFVKYGAISHGYLIYGIYGSGYYSWERRRNNTAESQIYRSAATIISFLKAASLKILEPDYFGYIILLVSIFDNSYEIVRKVGEHVEREDLKYKRFFTLAVVAYDIAKFIGKLVSTIKGKNELVENAIRFVSIYLNARYKHIFVTKVSSDPVSLLHPLQSLLAQLCMNYSFFNISLLAPTSGDQTNISSGSKDTLSALSHASSISLVESNVLCSQIKTGFWVRNGNSVISQYEISHTFYDECGSLYLEQLAIIGKVIEMEDILKAWEFSDCILSTSPIPFNETIYEDRASAMLLEMITKLYHLFTYRLSFDSSMTRDRLSYLQTRAELAYTLCHQEKGYSDLKEQFEGVPFFDEVFEEIAQFIPPRSLRDYGHYALKNNLYSKLDPFDFLNKYVSSDDVQDSILEKLADIKNKKKEDIVLKPVLYDLNSSDLKKMEPLADTFKSNLFAKFLYKVLRFSIDSDQDDHLMATLHLLHAILEDDSLRYLDGEQHISSFVDIPICNILLGIVERKSSSAIIAKKAASILDIILLKDDAVLQSLVDCFGEEHIKNFRKSKHGKGLETRNERAHRLAHKRQRRILERIRGQQKKFMSRNKDFFKDADLETSFTGKDKEQDKHTEENNARVCILCRKPENDSEIFGIPTLISKSSVFWNFPNIFKPGSYPPSFIPGADMSVDWNVHSEKGLSYFDHGERTDSNVIPLFPRPRVDGSSKFDPQKDRHKRDETLNTTEPPIKQPFCFSKDVITGCPHGMHLSCFLDMLKKKGYKVTRFLCPLCQKYCNSFIPSLNDPRTKLDPMGKPVVLDAMDMDNEVGNENSSMIGEKVLDQKLRDLLKDYDEKKTHIKEELASLDKQNELLRDVRAEFVECVDPEISSALLIGSTLQMYEIANRYKETEKRVSNLTRSGTTFTSVPKCHIEDISPTLLSDISLLVLRSLIQYRALMHFVSDAEMNDHEFQTSEKEMAHHRYLGFLDSVLVRFFSGKESFDTIIRSVLARFITRITLCAMSKLSEDVSTNLFSSFCYEIKTKTHKEDECFDIFCNGLSARLGIDTPKSVKNSLYSIVCTWFARYKSQIALLAECFNFSSTEHLIGNVDELFESTNLNNTIEHSSMIAEINSLLSLSKQNYVILDYPAPVLLQPMAPKISDYLDGSFGNISSRLVSDTKYVICMLCGQAVTRMGEHTPKCQFGPGTHCLFFSPYHNRLDLFLKPQSFLARHDLPGEVVGHLSSPYLNKYGEAAGGLLGGGEAGTLHLDRFWYLNQCWLNQSLIASEFASLADSQFGGLRLNVPFTLDDDAQEFFTLNLQNAPNVENDLALMNAALRLRAFPFPERDTRGDIEEDDDENDGDQNMTDDDEFEDDDNPLW